MRRGLDPHARFRELIGARLDRPLGRAELRSLAAHLKSCPACRQVEREYREQRELLRGLPVRIPPRDLWARTSAALDQEIARGSYRAPSFGRGFASERRAAAPVALMTTVAVMSVVAALVLVQFGPPVNPPDASAARATPFAVRPQRLSFIGTGGSDVAIYRTEVSRVCPPSAPDCDVSDGLVRTPVALPGRMRAQNAALNPSGTQLAVVGEYVGEEVIAVVMFQPDDASSDQPTEPAAPPAGTAEPSTERSVAPTEPTPRPAETPAASTPGPVLVESHAPGRPTADAPTHAALATFVASPAASPPATAVTGLTVLSILEDVQSTGAPPAWSPSGDVLAFSAMPADESHGPDVYVWSPGDATARAITNDHSSYFASWSGDRIVISRVHGGDGDGAAARVATVVIDPATLEARRVNGPQMWLPAVNAQGTSAVVWSGALEMHDRQPVERAGALYVVDWSALDPYGERAPASAPTTQPADEPSPEPTDRPTDEPTVQPTVEPTAEPTTRPSEEPTEDPTAAPSAVPSGEPTDEPMSTSGASGSPGPTTGGSAGSLTGKAERAAQGRTPTPADEPAPQATGEPDEIDEPPATDEPRATGEPQATNAPAITDQPRPTAEPEDTAEPEPSASSPPGAEQTERPTASPLPPSPSPPSPSPPSPSPPSPSPEPELTVELVPIDPERDPRAAPVADWQIRWSADGDVLGVWIADAPRSSWGRLVVFAVDRATSSIRHDDPLLDPTLARRGFALGHSRVAWVGPSDENPEGEVRIRTWGSDGVGGLRLDSPELEELLPAF